jgi:hypothetical protein
MWGGAWLWDLALDLVILTSMVIVKSNKINPIVYNRLISLNQQDDGQAIKGIGG